MPVSNAAPTPKSLAERTVAGFRVINFAGDLTQPVKMLMQSAEAASGKPVDETMERLLRMRAAAIQSMAFSGDAKDLRQYSDQLKKVSLSKPLTAQVVAQGSAQNEATDLQVRRRTHGWGTGTSRQWQPDSEQAAAADEVAGAHIR